MKMPLACPCMRRSPLDVRGPEPGHHERVRCAVRAQQLLHVGLCFPSQPSLGGLYLLLRRRFVPCSGRVASCMCRRGSNTQTLLLPVLSDSNSVACAVRDNLTRQWPGPTCPLGNESAAWSERDKLTSFILRQSWIISPHLA